MHLREYETLLKAQDWQRDHSVRGERARKELEIISRLTPHHRQLYFQFVGVPELC